MIATTHNKKGYFALRAGRALRARPYLGLYLRSRLTVKSTLSIILVLFVALLSSNLVATPKQLTISYYEKCYIGWLEEKYRSQILMCFNNFAKGKGYINLYFGHDAKSLEPVICQSKTNYKMVDGELVIRVRTGACSYGDTTLRRTVRCTEPEPEWLNCSYRGSDIKLRLYKEE